ncbi:MAG: exo-alpha-sialidase [Planctomycetes bacterium]|nr:exo-alpha-sialidase [Planctomycetota bacterium]
MSRIQILAVISCTATALTPVGVCGDERPDAPPIKIVRRLFNQKDEVKLGLSTVKGEHQVLYRATGDSYKFCHQQNLAVWQGKLFLMWSNGITHEDHNGQRILYCDTPDGVKWSQPAVLTEDHDGPGPLACVSAGWHDAGDTLVAYYTAIMEKRPGIDERNALFSLTSKDGKTWSKPTKLAQGFFIEGPRPLPSGRLLMNGQWADRQPRLRFTDSTDGVSGWKDGKIPRVGNVFTFPEPSWFVRADGTIVMIFRTKSGDPWIYAGVSKDNGESWSKPVKTNFPDATARAFAGNLPDGTAFIISNPSRVPNKTHPSIGRRNPLTIALSNDGVLFDRAFVIRSEETSMRFKGINKLDGWQYPTAVVWKDHLYVAYSINKEDEGVTRIALRDLQAVASRKSADRNKPMKVIAQPNVKTDRLGGIDIPSAEKLQKMHASQYVLRAHTGRMTK